MSDVASGGFSEALSEARSRDRIGDRVHLGIAVWTMATIPTGTTPAAITSGVLMGYAILRLWATRQTYHYMGRHAITWILLAWLAWHAISLAWSNDVRQGLDELAIFRLQVPLIFGLWPIIDRYRVLAASLAAGALITLAAQTLQLSGLEFGWYDPIVPDRYPGFHHPSGTAFYEMVVGGGALAIAIRTTHTLRRIVAFVLCLGCLGGIILTGSRGPWLATIVSWPPIAFMSIRAALAMSPGRRRLATGVGVGVLLAGVTLVMSLDTPRARVLDAADEARAALVDGDARSSVGARLVQIRHAWTLFREHPWRGIGAGSWMIEARRVAGRDPDPAVDRHEPDRVPVLPHPHSTFFYMLCIYGIPGIAILIAFWGVLIRSGWNGRHDRDVDGALIALPGIVVGTALASLVDSHHLSTAGTTTLMSIVGVIMYLDLVRRDRMESGDPADTTDTSVTASA